MSVINATASVRARPALAVPTVVVPVALYAVALVVRLAAMTVISFPLTEGSAYYTAVARSLASGRGPVIDSIWSYATPPLNLPGKPAFELWQPLASVLAAWPMSVFGTSFNSAQLGFAAVGALLSPLAWLVARDAAQRLELPDNRQRYVALGAGLLTAVAGPFVLTAALPDSTLPFTVLAVAACVAMPAAAEGNRRALIALGLLLGLAYLTRMEAVYLGAVFAGLAWTSGVRGRLLAARVGAVAVIGALVATPWWLRNFATFGTPMPGNLADNAFMTANYQIFDFDSRPNLFEWAAQGPLTIGAHVAQALWHDAVDVLLVPGNVVVVAALLTIAFGWRRWRTFSNTSLAALVAYGVVAFVVTSLVFPVATLWGTFEHAAGPLFVAFAVIAVMGTDALVAKVRAWRAWPRPNAGIAPAALAAVALAMTALQLLLAGLQSDARERQISAVAEALRANTVALAGTPVITDRPVWMSDALGVPTLALPQESADTTLAVARRFGADLVVLVDGMPAGPAFASRGLPYRNCFDQLPIKPPADAPDLIVMQVAESCR